MDSASAGDTQPGKDPDIFAHAFKVNMWGTATYLAAGIYSVLVIVTYFLDGSFTILTLSKALGGTAALLLAASFALSGFCYYWNFLDTKIGYRKYLGLMGYWFALLYSFSLFVVDPDRYFFGFFENFFSVDFMLGLTAMALFTFMALISNDAAMRAMGPHTWRRSMRVGYLAWFLLALRAYFIENALWVHWFLTLRGFPPPRMLLSALVVLVILFRISIEVSKYLRRQHMQPPDPPRTNLRT